MPEPFLHCAAKVQTFIELAKENEDFDIINRIKKQKHQRRRLGLKCQNAIPSMLLRAKITTFFQITHFMSKKIGDLIQKKWLAHCWSVSLAQQCHDREQQTQNTGNCPDNGTIKQGTLAAVLTDKTALIQGRLTFIGYLEVVLALFQAAFCHKKRKGYAKFVRCVVEEVNLGDAANNNI